MGGGDGIRIQGLLEVWHASAAGAQGLGLRVILSALNPKPKLSRLKPQNP